MKAELIWNTALPLTTHPQLDDIDLSEIPETGGIYIFSRKFGEKEDILYVGMANSLRRRIKQQFNNRELMEGIQQATRGSRCLRYATLKTRQTDIDATLRLIEKEMIRYFIGEGHALLNKQGTKISFHVFKNTFNEDDFSSNIPDELHVSI